MSIMVLISRNERHLMQKTAQKKYCLQAYSNSRQASLFSVLCSLFSVLCSLFSVLCSLPAKQRIDKGFQDLML
ncbi:hypothetical protein EAE91_08885 [Photorhabdus noenieputensis]|uniref:hypothetical protein n=1 Tax=Photorhabdus noenieputensis TaxID=1208607 RepID=UPI001BD4D5DD|nr:hypothetical protein [Photorhabdus noenieputensis]MBS9437284.1 hypothetical protein [Photorhabdus noenieputensis]MCK3668597.1 hypothetical protein [Photorhabdus noenieputensis]